MKIIGVYGTFCGIHRKLNGATHSIPNEAIGLAVTFDNLRTLNGANHRYSMEQLIIEQ